MPNSGAGIVFMNLIRKWRCETVVSDGTGMRLYY